MDQQAPLPNAQLTDDINTDGVSDPICLSSGVHVHRHVAVVVITPQVWFDLLSE